MQVDIVARGAGSRLGKLSAHTPKALLPHGRGTILSTLLERLAEHGMMHAIISVGPPERDGLFRFNSQDDWCGIPLRYCAEE